MELIQSNVDVMKSKITDDMNINAIQGNALNLSMYEDNTFDVVEYDYSYKIADEDEKTKDFSGETIFWILRK